MSYSQTSLHHLLDMSNLLGTRVRTMLDYERDPYVHCEGPLIKAKADSSSYGTLGNHYVRVPPMWGPSRLFSVWAVGGSLTIVWGRARKLLNPLHR